MLDTNLTRIPLRFRASVLVFVLVPALLVAETVEETARKIASRYRNAVISVRLTTRQRMVVAGREMNKDDRVQEGTGVVLDSTGLTVLSLNAVDPLGGSMAESFGLDENSDYRWESQISDVKMRFPSEGEIAGTVILRDRDLDLVFVRPTENLESAPRDIDLAAHDSLDVLEQMVILGRMGKSAGRSSSVLLGRVKAVVQKPRLFYVPDPMTSYAGLGQPVFGLSGKLVGLLLMRTMPGRSSGGSLVIVLPAPEILEIVNQIPASARTGQ